jgi:Ca2+-binding EF-hand superfamily protein
VSSARYEIINKAFEIADINGDGVIDCKDLSEVFNANDHPNVVSGEWNVPQVYKTFLDQFDTNDDGEVIISLKLFIVFNQQTVNVSPTPLSSLQFVMLSKVFMISI